MHMYATVLLVMTILHHCGLPQERPSVKPSTAMDLPELSVSEVLRAFDVQDSDIEYLDDPPGKVRVVQCVAKLKGTTKTIVIVIELKSPVITITPNGKTDNSIVRQAQVKLVSISGK